MEVLNQRRVWGGLCTACLECVATHEITHRGGCRVRSMRVLRGMRGGSSVP